MASLSDAGGDGTPAVAIPTARGVYVSGVNKRVDREALLAHFSACGDIEHCDFSEKPRQGFAWLRFVTQDAASKAVRTLHHSELRGTVIAVRHEIGLSATGARVVAPVRQGTAVTYAGKGVLVGNVEYPIPSGAYLMRLLQLCHSSAGPPGKQALIDALLDARFGNRHAKELSESLAIVNALPVCSQRVGADIRLAESARVFVLGDGVSPFTAITMLLFAPPSWSFTSIDPLMAFDPAALGPAFADRLTCVAALSQDFVLPPLAEAAPGSAGGAGDAAGAAPANGSAAQRPLSVVVACHSHAPLQEFWDRLPPPKVALSLPCCGKMWSLLAEPAVHEYEDYEVFSPKRRVFIYARGVGDVA